MGGIGKLKWHSGKHPVLRRFWGFYSDLERITGSYDVMHGEFHHIRYPLAMYNPTILDPDTNYLRIIAKKGKMMQTFYVKVTPQAEPIVREFVRDYPNTRYLLEFYKTTIRPQADPRRQAEQEDMDNMLEAANIDPEIFLEQMVRN